VSVDSEGVVSENGVENGDSDTESDVSMGLDSEAFATSTNEAEFKGVYLRANLCPSVLDQDVNYASADANNSSVRSSTDSVGSRYIIDSGATHSMSPVRTEFVYVNTKKPVVTRVANGHQINSRGQDCF
jgi:hypothetical protein